MSEEQVFKESGGAIFFYFAECLIDAALKLGLDAEISKKLVRQALYGAACLIQDKSLEEIIVLKNDVTSKGGTTEAALKVLNKNNELEVLLKKTLSNCLKNEDLLKNKTRGKRR